jgi:hypothetical protein
VVVDAHVSGAFYVFSDPAARAAIVRGFLTGRTGPSIEARQGFEFFGVQFKVSHDVGFAASDWRAVVRTAAS